MTTYKGLYTFLFVVLGFFGLITIACTDGDGIDMPDDSATCTVNGQSDPMCQSKIEEQVQEAVETVKEIPSTIQESASQALQDAGEDAYDAADKAVCGDDGLAPTIGGSCVK